MSDTISPHLSLAAEQQTRVREKITRELGPIITDLLHERDVIEIMLNDDGRLWVERLGEQMQPVGVMAAWQAEALIGTVASTLHGHVTRESPILECELPIDGSRFEALIPPIVPAPVFTLRRKALKIFTLDDYVASNIMTATQRNILRQAIRQHDNILVVGGTSTGKTTLTNALIDDIATQFLLQRLVIIEDTGELQCRSENRVMLHARPPTSICCGCLKPRCVCDPTVSWSAKSGAPRRCPCSKPGIPATPAGLLRSIRKTSEKEGKIYRFPFVNIGYILQNG